MTSPIASVVLRRVRTIYLLRSVGGHALVCLGVFVVALFGIGHEVWVSQVLQNTPSIVHVRTFVMFAVQTFLNTEFIVQLYTTLALIAFFALLLDAFRVIQTLSFRKLVVA